MITVKKIIDILKEKGFLIEYNIKEEKNIEYISYNSKDIKKNTLFFCKGFHFKEEYLNQAFTEGAILYISEKKYNINMPYILVNDIQKASAIIASAFYDYPSKKLKLIGITGTKGKTTTASFINSILDEYTSKKTAKISSINNYTGVRDEVASLTTPEPLDLHKYFYEAYSSNCEYLTMEVSSQGYKKDRVYDIRYDYGMFLNIGEDHISEIEHPNFDDYFNCKLQLMKNCNVAIINRDIDVFNVVFNECTAKEIITYGSNNKADYYYTNIVKENNGFEFDIVNEKNSYRQTFKINMAGRFNIENVTAAIALAKNMNIDDEIIKRALLKTEVSGRMNVFENDNITVIVDYAHNKISYEKLFDSIKQDYPNRRVVCVGGCDGSRAYNRRKEYADAINNIANYVYLTACDPQYEEVKDICNDIIKYLNNNVKYEIIEDRKEAILKAITNSKKNDVIVITSKAGENFIKIKGVLEPYESDVVIARKTVSKIR